MRPLFNRLLSTLTEWSAREAYAYCCRAWFIFSDQVGWRAATSS